jgi:hypothetical protein
MGREKNKRSAKGLDPLLSDDALLVLCDSAAMRDAAKLTTTSTWFSERAWQWCRNSAENNT